MVLQAPDTWGTRSGVVDLAWELTDFVTKANDIKHIGNNKVVVQGQVSPRFKTNLIRIVAQSKKKLTTI